MAIRHRVHGLYQSLSRTDFKLTLVLDKKMNFYASLCTVRAEEALFFAPSRSISTGFCPAYASRRASQPSSAQTDRVGTGYTEVLIRNSR